MQDCNIDMSLNAEYFRSSITFLIFPGQLVYHSVLRLQGNTLYIYFELFKLF